MNISVVCRNANSQHLPPAAGPEVRMAACRSISGIFIYIGHVNSLVGLFFFFIIKAKTVTFYVNVVTVTARLDPSITPRFPSLLVLLTLTSLCSTCDESLKP